MGNGEWGMGNEELIMGNEELVMGNIGLSFPLFDFALPICLTRQLLL